MVGRARRAAAGLMLTAALLAVSACASGESGEGAGPSPTATTTTATTLSEAPECAESVAGLVDAVASLVGTFEPATDPPATDPPVGTGDDPGAGTMEGVQAALDETHRAVRAYGCDQERMQEATEQGLDAITVSDPVAAAVLARVSNTLLGRVPDEAAEVSVAPGDDLHAVIAGLPAGSTVRLAAGEFALDEPLVLLEGVELRGASTDETAVVSTAPGAGIIDVSGGRLVIADLTVRVDGTASGIIGGPRARLVLESVRVTGAQFDADRSGGAGLQLVGAPPAEHPETAGESGTTREQTSVEITDSTFDGNAWAGIVVGGEHRVSIERVQVRDNGEVGIVFLDAASGSVGDSDIADNPLGIGVSGRSVPVLESLRVSGGLVGLQLEGTSSASIRGLTLSGTEQAGVIVTGEATGALDGVVCEDLQFGLVVADTAAPTIGEIACTVARGT